MLQSTQFYALEEIFHSDYLSKMGDLLSKKDEVLVFSGPAGSGKTTTLLSVFGAYLTNTVETKLVLLGDLNDTENAKLALAAVKAGNMTLAQEQSDSAVDTLEKLYSIGLVNKDMNVAVTIISQRLLPKLCEYCKKPLPQTEVDHELDDFRSDNVTLYCPIGCSHCEGKGFKGKTAIHEFLQISRAMLHMVLNSATKEEIKRQAKLEGMQTFKDRAVKSAMEGSIFIKDALLP